VNEVLRRALEEEVRKRRREELKATAAELGELFSRIPDKEIVNSQKHNGDAR